MFQHPDVFRPHVPRNQLLLTTGYDGRRNIVSYEGKNYAPVRCTRDMTDESTDGRQQYDDGAFLAAVREHEPASTSEVADSVGCTRRNADYRLRRLRDEDRVRSKTVGNSLVWFLIDDE